MNEFVTFLLQNLVQVIFSLIGLVITIFVIPWLKTVVIPWLKDKHLYEIVYKFVSAAEKYATTHDIDKKTYVINLLTEKGIAVTPVVEALIETACEELDLMKQKTAAQLVAPEEAGEDTPTETEE